VVGKVYLARYLQYNLFPDLLDLATRLVRYTTFCPQIVRVARIILQKFHRDRVIENIRKPQLILIITPKEDQLIYHLRWSHKPVIWCRRVLHHRFSTADLDGCMVTNTQVCHNRSRVRVSKVVCLLQWISSLRMSKKPSWAFWTF
jgi:hypothetical protein